MPGRRAHVSPVLRLAGRVAALLAFCTVVAFGSMAFAQRIGEDLRLTHELARTRHDVRALEIRRAEQVREIHRLAQPQGVVPYIYQRLRMVKPGQTLIYLVPAPSSTP